MSDADLLRSLADSEAVRVQITRSGRYLDERRWEDYAALYTEDGVLELPFGSWTGREAILAQVKTDLAGYVATQHVSSNHDVEFEGDTAHARFTFIATHVTSADGTAFWRGGGAYAAQMRRVGSGWQIARLAVDAAWRSATGAALPAI